MPKKMAIIPLTLFLGACPAPIDTGIGRPPEERFVCEADPQAPDTAPLQAFTASNGALVYLKEDVDARDGKVATWIVQWRGVTFSCRSQLGWHKTYWDEYEEQ